MTDLMVPPYGSAQRWWHVTMRLVLAIGACIAPSQATAQDEPDVVVLTSGNRMTGSVNDLTRGELSFAIDGAGSVDIDWNNIEMLRSSQDLDIELRSGERLSGSIDSAEAGQMAVQTAEGPRLVAFSDVIRITPIAASIAARTTGSVEAGLSLLQANDEFDLTFNADAENRTRHYLTEVMLASVLRIRDGPDYTRTHFTLASRRFLQKRWFVLGRFEVEEDRKLDLDVRLLAGGALGRTLVQSNRAELALYGGLDYNHEKYRDIPGTDNSAEALGTVEFDWFELAGNTELSLIGTTYVGLTRSRARFNLEANLQHDIVRNFYVSLNFFGTYDSDPPSDLDKSDLGLGLTFGHSF